MAARQHAPSASWRRRLAGAALALAWPALAAAGPYSNLFVFGDSLSDSGNVFAATSVNPIAPFTEATPLSPPYFNGRFSNGPNYADLLGVRLGVVPAASGLLPSLTPEFGPLFPLGTNYAWGGANTGPAVLPVGGLSVPSLYRSSLPGPGETPSQLQMFGLTLPATGADPNALYVLWGGGNDLRDAVKVAKDHPATALADGEAVVSAAIDNLRGALLTLDAMGAQHVLVPNLPDIGLTPETRDWNTDPQFSLTAYATTLTGNFNVRLDAMLGGISGLDIRPFDTYAFFNDLVSHPGSFGLADVSTPCLATGELSIFIGGAVCAAPDSMLYWDNHHPSATVHALLADRMFTAAVPEPGTTALLLAGLGGLLGLARRRRGAQCADENPEAAAVAGR